MEALDVACGSYMMLAESQNLHESHFLKRGTATSTYETIVRINEMVHMKALCQV